MALNKTKFKKLQSMFNDCSQLFIVMGDVIRQKILLQLAEAGADGINVGELTAKSSLSRPAISHHLKVLKECGLITSEKTGTQIFYKADYKRHLEKIGDFVTKALNFIDEVENSPSS
ncbi:MAG: metalloregulator ArsR/SmtB family transcription factor [Treponema sp.]|nr:metalloregulator ArsR/SmtB family transcription factor [Spirochaetia bacterium]MDY4901944.1 metalloregulator ArsR/SmtB family transcription factor [Treponema sp.]